MTNKIFLVAIAVILWIYASFWCFNHIDAWFGIAVFILGTYISIKQLENNNKKSE
jgi:hypothetical protein